ncbi:M48 family metallopeptidase [Planctomycetota bacterium]|nr:M48 family metallopeptidase [Planctomycetota bacterium]
MADTTKLHKISSQSFEHPMDRAALDTLKKTVGFDRFMRGIAKVVDDRIWHISNESSNIRLSEKQLPSVYRIYREVANTLDLDPVPPLYLQHNVNVNAYTSGVDKPFIVVTSGIVEGFSDDELAFVLGHEMGHILAGHVLYRMVAVQLGAVVKILGDLTPFGGLISMSLYAALLYWCRCSELTADRCGLLAVQDPEIALRANMMLGAGPGPKIVKELSLDAFLEQARQFEEESAGKLDQMYRVVLEMDRSHPWVVKRASEIDRWVQAGEYQKILGGDYQKRAAAVISQMGARADDGDATESMAAEAETAISGALTRSYGVHLAPRIPEEALHLALGAYVDTLETHEKVVVLYDRTLAGNGDRGVVLSDRRACSSARPKQGIYYRDITTMKRTAGGLLSDCGLIINGLELRFHTRSLRDAFADAVKGAAIAFRGEAPKEE